MDLFEVGAKVKLKAFMLLVGFVHGRGGDFVQPSKTVFSRAAKSLNISLGLFFLIFFLPATAECVCLCRKR